MEETFVENCVVRVKQHCQDDAKNIIPDQQQPSPSPDRAPTGELIEYSCSGILLHPSKGLILTSGVAFAEFVKQRPRIFSQYSTKPRQHQWFQPGGAAPRNIRYLTPKDLNALLSVEVGVAITRNKNTTDSKSAQRSNTARENNFAVYDAELIVLWKCQEFADELQRLFPAKDGWQFTEEAPGPDGKLQRDAKRTTRVWDDERDGQFVEPVGMSSSSKQEMEENFVSWMALLKVKNPDGHFHKYRKPSLSSAIRLHQGDPLYLCGTPFGSMCPSVFLNSISRGIVTNTAGLANALIMTDARCMPGSEGGGAYVIPRNETSRKRRLVGMIVAPLCWKANEWIGLSLACSIQSVLDSLRVLVHWDGSDEPVVSLDSIKRGPPMGFIEHSMMSVVLVRVGTVWGSGVILDRSEGIIVTCYHVIKDAKRKRVQVRLDHPPRLWMGAEILYATGSNGTYDIAFLKLLNTKDKPALHSLPPVSIQHYQKGAPVFVVGHALIGPGASMSPSVTSGVMSTVVTLGRRPVMLQSSCAVHSGASGGALVCANTGALLGIVSSNSRDTDTGASFPHVNFSIPMTVIQPVLRRYLATNDVSVFQQLSRDDEEVKALWRLEETNDQWASPMSKSKL